jgi:hypothetical protein
MCTECFLVFPKKLKSAKCPVCTQNILTYGPSDDCFPTLLS